MGWLLPIAGLAVCTGGFLAATCTLAGCLNRWMDDEWASVRQHDRMRRALARRR